MSGFMTLPSLEDGSDCVACQLGNEMDEKLETATRDFIMPYEFPLDRIIRLCNTHMNEFTKMYEEDDHTYIWNYISGFTVSCNY